MKINEIYPKDEFDKLLRKVRQHVAEVYPNTEIVNIVVNKKHVVIKIRYGSICLEKKDFM